MDDAEIKKKLFEIYEASGADPDGDVTFHCPVEKAFIWTLDAVKDLKDDYNECLDNG